MLLADSYRSHGRVGTAVILKLGERVGRPVPGIILTGETGPECQQDNQAHGIGVLQ
ncbi:hypothetical protein [Azospirillum canadense]|uniref:hypothetical protein n=1 Tax=Azospirillum canadense TaxID=403962 RepID=UPI0022263065|nr:hypothetical protein [Azospirillum canadense]MCW2239212.1 hypothetical protein [Azospirillum canadense]